MTDSVTRLDSIETSSPAEAYPSYRAYRTSLNADEVSASLSLYEKVDARDGKNRVDQFLGCRSFAWFVRDNETGLVKIQSNSCRLRWCPFCSGGKQSFIIHSITDWAKTQTNLRFITLTLKHTSEPLPGQIDRLYKAFQLMRRNKQFKKVVRSGIWFFQVKLNKDKTEWHPHLHILVTGQYINKSMLSAVWLKCTGSSKIVDIAYVHSRAAIIKYVARYCARPANLSDMPDMFRLDVFDALHHRRLCGSWNCGPDLKLTLPKSVESGRYTTLGFWSTVHELSHTDHSAKTILICWAHHLVIESGISVSSVDDQIDQIPDLSFEYPDETDIDAQFDFR